MYVIRQDKPQYDKLDSQVTLGEVCNSVQDAGLIKMRSQLGT